MEISPRAKDPEVLGRAHAEACVPLTEDEDFGLLAYAGGHRTAGVLLIRRFPHDVRSGLGEAVSTVVTELGDRIRGAFAVLDRGELVSRGHPHP